jgi:quercetin dioxygenase-like cupin family protein
MAYKYYPNTQEKAVFVPDGPLPQVLFTQGEVKVLVGGLEAGQKIPAHPEGLAVYHFLEGRGWMLVDGERLAVSPGSTVIALAGAPRGMEAETRLTFLASRITELAHDTG